MVVPGKFLAFRGPRDAVDHRGSLQPSDYVEVFKTLNVSTIVRLNKAEYNKKTFTAAGFLHVDQVFEDCSVPPSNIVDSFLRRAEGLKPGQVMAVHCLAGLGRTGTLIAMYMMKHMGFTANEAMGWLRVCRPGSIIGPQQQFLADHEARMHRLGAAGVPGLGNQLVNSTFAQTSSPSNYKSQDGMAQSKVLAEMVTDGMLNRRKKAVQVDSQQEAATRSFLPWLGQQNQQAASQREKAPLPKASQKQSPSGGGMKRSISNPSLLQMATESKKTQSTRAPIQSASLRNVNANKSSGFGVSTPCARRARSTTCPTCRTCRGCFRAAAPPPPPFLKIPAAVAQTKTPRTQTSMRTPRWCARTALTDLTGLQLHPPLAPGVCALEAWRSCTAMRLHTCWSLLRRRRERRR